MGISTVIWKAIRSGSDIFPITFGNRFGELILFVFLL